jgi:hypothetical protein
MAIVSSTYELDDHAQADGRTWVKESHTDSSGIVHTLNYLAPQGADYQAIANARAVVLAVNLADQEYQELVENG